MFPTDLVALPTSILVGELLDLAFAYQYLMSCLLQSLVGELLDLIFLLT